MAKMTPWYKVVTPRKEVREGRSFSPDEFAIALEQVVAETAPQDYRDPFQFFSRTCFTRALKNHAGMVLRRLSGKTENTAPVLTLVTQFGGGKTHTLTALYHLANAGSHASELPGVLDLLSDAGITDAPSARVGVFVGNAWDPAEGRETPWIDLARQLAGDKGVAVLGASAATTPPGTEAIGKVFAAAEAPVLLLFDEVLNFVNRHRNMAESFHSFIQNLTVAVTGTIGAAAVISLPRSQVEMTDWDQQWQDRITKVVRRVAQDLIANDEAEIGEVVRRRLFKDLGDERIRRKIAKNYADWCFERTARLPAEWMAVDSSRTEIKAREFLKNRFETCYPFHPSTLSVFRRKWSALTQFQQTRGTLAMLAQWISWAAHTHFQEARTEPLITLGSAPLNIPEFRAVVLGQLGEQRLDAAIDADLAGSTSHATALDADTQGPLRGIHRRVGTAIFFESSGGQVEKVAHLPELRFALGEPEVDTTSIDNATVALDASGFFIHKVGTDGFRIHHQATLKKVVSDRRASLDEETEIKPAARKLIEDVFSHGTNLSIVPFPENGEEIQDMPRLTLVIVDPEVEWKDNGQTVEQIAEWTKDRGTSPRLYPGALVWCIKKPGRELRDRVELWLAWQRVAREMAEGILGPEYDSTDRAEVKANIKTAETAAKDEVWSGYRYVALSDTREKNGLKVIDLGAGHSSSSGTLCGRVVSALKAEALLNESVGAGYLDRHWPPAFKETEAWPLKSLRQSFLDGSLTRLIDPDSVLRQKIVEFVQNGDFGLASGAKDDRKYGRLWYAESITEDEVVFEPSVFLLTKTKSEELRSKTEEEMQSESETNSESNTQSDTSNENVGNEQESGSGSTSDDQKVILNLKGVVPPELWNRFGIQIIPKLKSSKEFTIKIDVNTVISSSASKNFEADLKKVLTELELGDKIKIDYS